MSESPVKISANFSGRRVTVVGLGRFGGGLGVTRWLCGQGAAVTVSDRAPRDELADSVAKLEGCDVKLHLGGHREEDFLDAELLVVNPAFPKDHPLLAAAEKARVPRTSEINLFIERCVAPIVGVTGSVGKSTTTAMIGCVLARRFTAHVGGNIGKSLLEDLPAIKPDHVVVLELSSFQLEDLPIIGISPHVALVTNLVPNHLDRHGTMDIYGRAKKNIFRYQKPGDVLILNHGDEEVRTWAYEAKGRVEFFNDPAAGESQNQSQIQKFDLLVPGLHNQTNAQGAFAVARQFDIPRYTAAEALKTFAGLPHRIQFVTELAGVRYYNDSKCTTPAGAIVALDAFEPRKTIILLGGCDKSVCFGELGKALDARAKAVVAFGATRGMILSAVEKNRTDRHTPAAVGVDNLPAAVSAARKLAHSGDVILLSPACASYDQFTNYEQRGKNFIALAKGL